MTELAVRCRPPSRRATLAGALLAAAVVGAAAGADASTPPTTSAPPPPPFVYREGVLTPADGSFTAEFATAPAYDNDGAGTDSFVATIEEDGQSVVRYPLDGLGAGPDGPPAGRAALFAAASGEDAQWFANTPTRLGPYPASYFVVSLTLADGARATVYGVAVVREAGVTYAFATDRGPDDADAARAFVESFTIPLPSPAAGAATVAADGRWSVTFPDDAAPVARASSEAGFAYTEYRTSTGGDVASVRVTEVPSGFEWRDDVVAGFATAPGVTTATTIGGLPAFTAAFEHEGADVSALVVNGGDQVITVSYTDTAAPSAAAADAFVESFVVPAPAPPPSSGAAATSSPAG